MKATAHLDGLALFSSVPSGAKSALIRPFGFRAIAAQHVPFVEQPEGHREVRVCGIVAVGREGLDIRAIRVQLRGLRVLSAV